MNLRRGLCMAWVFFTVCWTGYFVWTSPEAFGCLVGRGQWCKYWEVTTFITAFAEIFGPPIGLLLTGVAAFWIASGLKL